MLDNKTLINSAILPQDFAKFVESETDILLLEPQWRSWIAGGTSFPVLAVRYEAMWEHLDEIATFLGLDYDATLRFPAKKMRNNFNATLMGQCTNSSVYTSLRRRIDRTPSVFYPPCWD